MLEELDHSPDSSELLSWYTSLERGAISGYSSSVERRQMP